MVFKFLPPSRPQQNWSRVSVGNIEDRLTVMWASPIPCIRLPQIPCLVPQTRQLKGITSTLAQCSHAMPCSTPGRCKEHVQARLYQSLNLLECWPCHYARVDSSMFHVPDLIKEDATSITRLNLISWVWKYSDCVCKCRYKFADG